MLTGVPLLQDEGAIADVIARAGPRAAQFGHHPWVDWNPWSTGHISEKLRGRMSEGNFHSVVSQRFDSHLGEICDFAVIEIRGAAHSEE